VLTGRIDRAAIAPSLEAPRRAEIIDFKTDALEPDDGASLAARVEHYRPQIEAYRRAMAALTGLEPGSIAAVLAFTSVGRAVTVGGA
jgi:ATP-dependent helicase/nuclease subunit A